MTKSLDGIWTAEVYGPFGWESLGILILENGRIMGGGNRHYSSGRLQREGKNLKATIDVHYYGPPRAMFGESEETFQTMLDLQLNEADDVAEGKIRRSDKRNYDLQMRLTRRMGMPAE